MKNFFSIITIIFISIAYSYGQNITLDGKVSDLDSKKSLAGVTVTVISGGSTVTSTTTASNGDYSVAFPPGTNYSVKFSKSGFVSKFIVLDVAEINGEDMPAGGKIFQPMNMDLFANRPDVDFSFLDSEPVVTWYFDGNRMVYEKGKMQKTKSKIDDKLAEAANKSKNADAEYNNLIKEADAFYTSKKYKEALNKYVAALQIPGKQKEAHPNSRLLEIEDLLQKQDEKELAYKQENQAYLNLIAAADNFASAKEYSKAVDKYNEAIAMKSDEQYPKDRVKDLKEEIANAAKREEYDKVIKRADGFLKQNSLQAARDAYLQAQKLLPKEEYPTKQLASLSGQLDAQKAIKEQKDKYNAAVKEADNLYTAENYEQAILKYKEALTFESAATYPPGRIKMAQDIINEKAAAAQKAESFNKLVAEGDAHIGSKEFEPAIAKYTAAIAIMEDPAVQTKLDKAKQSLADKKNLEQQQEQINALMASAQEKMTAENYAKALEDFSAVLAINSTFPEAVAGKKKAEDLLAAKQSQQENDNKFNELVAAADKAFDSKTWQEAKTKYLAAQAVYDDKEHVNNRITEVEGKIKTEGLNSEIDGLMTSANGKITAEDFTGAINDFNAVMALKSDHAEAIAGKKKAEQLLADKESKQQQESAFNAVLALADKAFDDKDWEKAKENYLAAKAIFADREHVNKRLTEVESALKNALAKEENLAKIQTLLDEAEAAKPENKWTIVIQKYEKALALDTERTDVSGMLEAAKASKLAWEAAQSKEESLAQIQTLLDEASVLKPDNKWTEAILKYEQALAIDTERKDVSDLLAAAKESKIAYESQLAKEESNALIQVLLDEALALKSDNKWTEVIQKYEKALTIDETRNDVSALLSSAKESKTAWDAAQSKEEQEAQFNNIVAEADKAFANENWENARDKYLAAKAIFEDREHVNTRITESNAALAGMQSKAENEAKIQSLLEEATALKPTNQWSEVIAKYESALAIDAERKDVSDFLAAAKASKTAYEANQSKEESLAQIQVLLDEAEALKPENKWGQVIGKYESALVIDAERTDVSDLLAAAKASKAAYEANQSKEESLAQIQVLLDEAEALKPDNKWNEVISKYESALAIDAERTDISEKITAAKASKTAWEASQSQGQQFAELKASGDELFSNEKWNDAKVKYKSALLINADNGIDANLAIIETKLAEEEAAKNREADYALKMELGEGFVTAEEYKKALLSFQEALQIKNNDPLANKRILAVEEMLNAQKTESGDQNDKYDQFMILGKDALKNIDYGTAVNAFEGALTIFPEDAEAKRLLAEGRERMTALRMEEEEFAKHVEKGLSLYNQALIDNNNTGKLKAAKLKFEAAQQVRPNEALPQTKIEEINSLLGEIENKNAAKNEAAENEKLYQDQLQLAAVAGQGSKYQNAINYLKEAQKIKPEESFPGEEIKRYEAIIEVESSQMELNANYNSIITKADLAFDNKDYDGSIDLYKEALTVKQNENYPKSQIEKAKIAIENSAENLAMKEYQNFMDKADAQSLNKDFEKALANYKSALSVKEGDTAAQDKIDETQQILDNLLKAKRENESQKSLFKQFVADADQLFKSENYLEAKSTYEKAQRIDVNDSYVNKQIQLSIEKAQAKASENKDKRYTQSIASADGLFNKKEYDLAKEAYKRALSLRQYETYPRTQIAKIEAIESANVKAQGSAEYLGEQSNISIMEGAALLEQGEIEREKIKQKSISKRLTQYEGEEENRSLSDYDERVRYENEVTAIKDRRDQTTVAEEKMKNEIAKQVDGQLSEFERKSNQMNQFKEGELTRAGQQLVFISDDFDQENADYRALHKEAIEQLKEIENQRTVKDITEVAHNEIKLATANQEIEKIESGYNTYVDVSEEYNSVLEIQDAAILAEMRVAESSEEKGIIQRQLAEDIVVYEAQLQSKLSKEAGEVHQEQMKIDEQVKGAEKHFADAQIGKDDARYRAVDQLQDVDKGQVEQSKQRASNLVGKTQKNNQEVETVQNIQDEKARQNIKDLTVVDEDVKNRITTYERAQQKLKEEEVGEHQKAERQMLAVEKKEDLLRSQSTEDKKHIYEELKGQEISRDNKERGIDEQASKAKQETQKYVDGLENNNIKYNETIANTIGDDYPEGVTQENYVREDSKGIPVKVVTRRIVVTNGRGEVYIRTQTRNGLTYSKNGSPVTEQTWINGTENAKLEKHY